VDPVVVRMAGRRRWDGPIGELTIRERKVLAVMARAAPTTELPRAHVSVAGVGRHLTGIFQRLALSPWAEDQRRVLAVLE
jgi:hypothetical protein